MNEEKCWICGRTEKECKDELINAKGKVKMGAFDSDVLNVATTQLIVRYNFPFICTVCKMIIGGIIEGYMSKKDIIALIPLKEDIFKNKKHKQ